MLNLPGINDAQYYTGSTASTESLNRADAQMRNLLRVGGQLFDMAINAAQINEAVATGQATRASVEGLYGNILGSNGRVIRTSMEGVSDMASDAWEALKNWIKEMIRKVQDFFLKYSVFIKRTKDELKKLKSYLSSRMSTYEDVAVGMARATGSDKKLSTAPASITSTDAAKAGYYTKHQKGKLDIANLSESVKDRYDDEKILNETALKALFQQFAQPSKEVSNLSQTLLDAGDMGELKLKMDDKIDEILDLLLDVDHGSNGTKLTDIDDNRKAIFYVQMYYKFADQIIKFREACVKDYDKTYKTVSKLKGMKSSSLTVVRQTLHQRLLIVFRISSEFRKSAKKLIKYIHAAAKISTKDEDLMDLHDPAEASQPLKDRRDALSTKYA